MPTKQDVINQRNTAPKLYVLNEIKKGTVTLDELKREGLLEVRKDFFEAEMAKYYEAMAAEKRKEWDALKPMAHLTSSLPKMKRILDENPDCDFREEVKRAIEALDEPKWNEANELKRVRDYEDYLRFFPLGFHAHEAQEMIDDAPWLEAVKKDTLEAYEQYERQNPGKHVNEIKEARLRSRDEADWKIARERNTVKAYREYLEIHHSIGEHIAEAIEMIEKLSKKGEVLEAMTEDPNKYNAQEIREMVDDNVIEKDDVKRIFGNDFAKEIFNFTTPAQLVSGNVELPKELKSTEVYFWGMPSSGKTCAMGAIMSRANQKPYGLLGMPCSAHDYMNRLKNVFGYTGKLKVLPSSTSDDFIGEMRFKLTDPGSKEPHDMTCIDVAGEIFKTVYYSRNGLYVDNQRLETLNKVMKLLNAPSPNDNIHFFVVEYGLDAQKDDGIMVEDYLGETLNFLQGAEPAQGDMKNKNIFSKKTVGVYVLLTKFDMLLVDVGNGCDWCDSSVSDEDKATAYVKHKLYSLHQNITKACQKSGIANFKVLPFSVGEVKAQKLCRFDDEYTRGVLNELIRKTRAEKTGFWAKLMEFFKN